METVFGSRKTETVDPKVSLESYSLDPVGTVVSMWIGSRFNETIPSRTLQVLCDSEFEYSLVECQEAYRQLKKMYPEYANLTPRDIVMRIFKMIDTINLPPLDTVNFTFQIDDITVALREQMVRSRLPQNFWTQSSRTADMTQFDSTMMQTVVDAGPEAMCLYENTVEAIRQAYKGLVKLGVPDEDIRLAPVSMLHRVYWMVPYRTLKSIVRQRISWIAQIGLWGPLIQGIMNELRGFEITEVFAEGIGTPSDVVIKDGKVIDHKNDIDNEARYQGRDPLPVDPLWIAYKQGQGEDITYPELKNPSQYMAMKKLYLELWSDEVLQVLGWNRVNPSIPGPYDPSNIEGLI